MDGAAATRAGFAAGAAWFAATVGEIGEHWDAPGLGDAWSVRDLVGHTSRSLITVRDYLAAAGAPLESPDIASAADYYAATASAYADPAAVTQRGRDAGAALGADPVAAVRELAERVPAIVAGSPDDAGVATPFGTLRLVDYLPTRTFELVVHTCDLRAALGRPAEPPQAAAASALALAADLTASTGNTATVLRALTGRDPLPGGFTIL